MYSVQLESLVIQDSWKQAGSHLVREPWKLLQTASTIKFSLISQWARCTKLLQCEWPFLIARTDLTVHRQVWFCWEALLQLIPGNAAILTPWYLPCTESILLLPDLVSACSLGVQHSHFSHLKLWPFIASGRTFSCWVKRWVKVDPCSLYYLMFPY